MEISNLLGLPAHPLIVHAVVVLVPLVAIGAVGIVLWRGLRERIGWLVVTGATLTAVLVPLATASGESLEESVGETTLVERHAELGEQLLPWVIGLALVTMAFMLVARVGRTNRSLVILISAATLLIASGAVVDVALIGHSGAEATWGQMAGTTSLPSG